MSECELLILGASSDFGRALIRKVHKNYSRIFAHYCNFTEDLQKITEEVGADKIQWYQANLENEEEVAAMLAAIDADRGMPSHIVHFPSMRVVQERFHKTTWTQYQSRFDISLRSLVIVLTKYLPQMAKRKEGKVIAMASAYTINNPPRYISPYITEKYAVVGLVKALAEEYAEKGIQVNAVSPEMTKTKFLSEMPEMVVDQNALNSPLKRNLEISEIIPTLAFLLSEDADRITGQNIVITGGK